jgi:hypothetical protein
LVRAVLLLLLSHESPCRIFGSLEPFPNPFLPCVFLTASLLRVVGCSRSQAFSHLACAAFFAAFPASEFFAFLFCQKKRPECPRLST